MLTINPILAGPYDPSNFVAGTSNVNSTQSSDAIAGDQRRYTKFDHSAANVGSIELHFSDVLDAINPLQHIPVVSALYRAAMNEPMNPVSRITGDIVYGALMGPASALLGGLVAVGDTVLKAETGHTMAESAVAMLSSSPSSTTTQPTNDVSLASTTVPVPPTVATSPSNLAMTIPTPPSPRSLTSLTQPMSQQGIPLAAAKAYSLPNNKLPYGGVLDTRNILQPQDLASGLTPSNHVLKLGNTFQMGILAAGSKPQTSVPSQSLPQVSSSPNSIANTTVQTSSQNSLPQSLLDDIWALKAINQYKNAASATSQESLSTLDVKN